MGIVIKLNFSVTQNLLRMEPRFMLGF